MGQQAKDATGSDELTVLADRGYFSGEEVGACEGTGVTPICPKPLTSTAKADGRWGKQDFRYDPPSDTYRCPAGETLIRRFASVENGLTVRRRTVEHVFGTWKDWMGRSHFKTRTPKKVATEMSLHVLAYNLKRAIAVLGTEQLIGAIQS